eukprot:m.61301 g.61301  ORF g.61301 m.61301 type:complete len:363 (-) comp11397_c0_seq2:82-1170(-)
MEEEKKQPNKLNEERSIFLIGSKGAGKTTMVMRFLDRAQDTPKPTIALEYTFGRKPHVNNLGKDIVHIWELGGGVFLTDLMDTVISQTSIKNLSFVIAIDLSEPTKLWESITTLLKATRSRVDKILSELNARDSRLPAILRKKAWERVGPDHTDKELLDPFPVNLVIIGTKYDEFEQFDPEHRKIISKTLRFLAHINGASLLFISDKDERLIQKCKSLMNHLAFRTSAMRGVDIDHNRPLMISPGCDSLQQIGAPPMNIDSQKQLKFKDPVAMWGAAFAKYFPPSEDKKEVIEDPCADPSFAESAIDSKREAKNEVLEKYRIYAERRARELEKRHASSGQSKAAPPSGSSTRRTTRRRSQKT